MAKTKLILMFFSFCCTVSDVQAQVFPQLRFRHLTVDNGLSSNKVLCINQDKDGLMWFGTDNGLNRYDGYRFKHFFSDNTDSTSLTSNSIKQIEVDDKNNLWLSTGRGISYFNTNEQKAFKYQHDPANPASMTNDVNPRIYINKPGELPYFFSDSLYRFTALRSYQKIPVSLTPYEFGGEKIRSYSSFCRDRKNRLWAKGPDRVYLIDEKTFVPLKTILIPFKGIVQDIFFDDYNRCWISCWFGGIYIYDEEKKQWSTVKNTIPGIDVYHKTLEWMIDKNKFIVTCYEDGILLVDFKSGDSRFYKHDAFGKDAHYKLDVPDIYIDRQNILWLASNQGVFYVSPSSSLFDIIPVETPEKNDSTLATYVYNLKEEPSGFWLTKRYYGGVFWFDKNWRLKKYWKEIKPINTNIRAGNREKLTEGYDFLQKGNSMFISTNAGIAEMNLEDFSSLLYYPSQLKRPPAFRNMEPVNDSLWWVRSFDQGIFLFNPVTKKFISHYKGATACKDCLPTVLNFLFKTRAGEVFATSFIGLYKFNKAKDIFAPVVPVNASLFPSFIQRGLAEDGNGILWIATAVGPCAYDPVNNKIVKTFPEKEDINEVLRITADQYNNLWFCSNTGYWCWLRRQDKLIHFSFAMGLPDIDDGAFYTSGDGTVYSGGKDAVVKFYPYRLMNYASPATTKIVEINVNNEYKPLQVSPEGGKYLELKPFENNITVDFAIINYDIAGNSQFFYQLTPGENKWQQNEDGHLSFNNLPPGKYTLQVKGSNKISGNFTETDSLNFTIASRFYQTVWFSILLALVFLSGVYAFYRWRIKSIKKQAILKQKISEAEMMALRAQMNPHFIFNCLNSIDSLIQENEREKATAYLARFANLIRSILETSKNNVVPCWKDMETLKLYLELEELRCDKKFSYIINMADEILHGDYKVPPLVIQPFVENAIHHGLLNKIDADRKLVINVSVTQNHIHYIIRDNGVGRAKAESYKQLNKPLHQSMGMQITNDRINLFNQNSGGAVKITDLYDEHRNPSGTKVEVILLNQ